MVASDPPAPLGGAQSVMPSLLRLSSGNSGMLGGQGGVMPSQGAFPSLISPRGQFNNGSLLGNGSNVASLLNHPFSNGNASPMIYGGLNCPGGGIVGGPETDEIANGIGFNPEKTNHIASSGTSGQVQGQPFPSPSDNIMLPDNLHSKQLKSQTVQHPQQPYQSIRGGLGGGDPVKLESQVTGNQLGNPQQQLPPLRGLSQVKLESQWLQNMGNVASVKMEPQQSDDALLSPQQQKHQPMQQMSMPRHSSNAAAATTQLNVLQQQKMPQLHQHQLIRSLPPQSQPQFSPLSGPLRSPVKSVYEPGMCARRLTHYMYQQQHRPENNNIEFWRKFVAEYFAPNAKKKWCVSMYGSGRQTTGVFPQDVWHCEICKRKPGRGFEATVEVLPRLFKIKYESGTLEELLYVDMPREYQNSSGQIVLDYAKAIQESVFEQLRVVRDGQLRIVFSSELKICSWEFCAQRHEELIPRRLMIPQVSQLGAVAQKYQSSTQNTSSDVSVSELQTNCNMFAASARQLAKTLEVPLVNDLGYTKRYVRCLQISEVVNSMKDLIDCSRLTGEGPMESLAKFPRRTTTPSALLGQNQQPEQPLQQAMALNLNNHNEQGSSRGGTMQFPSTNGMATVNNSLYPSSSSTSNSTIAGLLRQNKMNSRQKIPINNANSLHSATSSVQIMSPAAQQKSPSFQPPMPSSSINPPQSSNGTLAVPSMMNSGNSPAVSNMQQPGFSGDANTKDTQSSAQKFIQEMMMNKSNQLNDGSLVATDSLRIDVKNVNGILPIGNSDLEIPTYLVGSGPMNNNSGLGPFCGMGQGSMVHGVRATMANNSINGRVGLVSMARNQSMNHQLPQEDLGNQIPGNLGAVNGFNGLPFD